jgi:hypothetical protein
MLFFVLFGFILGGTKYEPEIGNLQKNICSTTAILKNKLPAFQIDLLIKLQTY